MFSLEQACKMRISWSCSGYKFLWPRGTPPPKFMMSTPSSGQSKQDSDIQYLYLQSPPYNKQFFHPLAFILTYRYLQWLPLHNNNSHQSTSQTTNSQLINGWQMVCTKPHIISQRLPCTVYYWSLLIFFLVSVFIDIFWFWFWFWFYISL